jgi:hypothetical protein
VYRIIQQKPPLLVKLHHGDRSDRFGHRVNAENGIPADRFIALHIHQSLGFHVGNFPPPSDQRQRTRQLSRLEIATIKMAFNVAKLVY